MPDYVDISICLVNKKHLELYKKVLEQDVELKRKHGALDIRHIISAGKEQTWPDLFPVIDKKWKTTHAAVFSATTYKSRKHRNEVVAKIHADTETPTLSPSYLKKIDSQPVWCGDFETLIK